MRKYALGFFAVAAIIFVGIVFTQLQVAFGWGSPPCSPPNCDGALSAVNNNLVITTTATSDPAKASLSITATPGQNAVNTDPTNAGTPLATGQVIGLAQTPNADDAAASKWYVDQQVLAAGGGGKPVVTIYGVSSINIQSYAAYATNIGKTINNCLFGSGTACNINILNNGNVNVPNPGSGTACPNKNGSWTSVFEGYGPYIYINRQYFYRGTLNYGSGYWPNPEVPPQDQEDDIPLYHFAYNPTAVTISICGSYPYQVIPTDYSLYIQGADGTTDPRSGLGQISGVASACIPQDGSVPGVTMICNTCRICQQQ